MSRKVNIKLLPSQAKFFQSDAMHTAYIGGYGSGKTFVGVAKTLKKKLEMPGISVAYYLPTYPLLRDIAYPTFEDRLNDWGLNYELNKTDKEITIKDYGKIVMRSMDDPKYIVGYQVGYSLIDEVDVLGVSKMNDIFKRVIARNRVDIGSKNITDVVGTPEGFKWAYNFFVKNKKEGRTLINAKTRENPFLPETYIKTLEESYSAEELSAYLDGEFVNLHTGNVYKNFDRAKNNAGRFVEKDDVLHIGMDFNITNMSAVVHVIDVHPIAVAEITKAYDTPEMIHLIKSKYPNHKIVVYPDAAGGARKTSGKSDIHMLKEAGFTVRMRKSNPFVRDRINAMNNAFEDVNGSVTYYVNTDNCPEYTEALEQLPYKNGEPDKQSGFDHITDAGGYFVYTYRNQTKGLGRSKL
jgi:PBSX family phage terminase large subunit